MKKTFLAAVAMCVAAPIVGLGVSVPGAWAKPDATGPCNSPDCFVGGAGNGGVQSDFTAPGSHYIVYHGEPHVTVTQSGIPDKAGRKTQTGGVEPGSISGNFEKGVGHGTGTLC